MQKENQQNVVSRCGLTPNEYANVTHLAALCNEHDQITLKINPSMLQTRPIHETNDFLSYVDGALVGFLGLYQFNNHEIEISGMVHPKYRRKGVFSTLLSAAKQEIQQRDISKLIIINEKGSASGKSFLESLGAQYSFSEYWMKMTQMKLPQMSHPIHLRAASSKDMEVIAHMTAIGFNMDEAELLETMTKHREGEKNRERWLIERNGDAIGTLSMSYSDESSAFIYGFCVLPEHQGRGYGRQALALAIQTALNLNRTQIELEVACENNHALSLYQSCGFEVVRANDYYVQIIES
jgi:ribosomal protein S18 acetylase RimI-like enzyme